jgi:hypothetical protein
MTKNIDINNNQELEALLQSKNRLFKEDLPESMHILCDCISKYPAEYAIKHQIAENNSKE